MGLIQHRLHLAGALLVGMAGADPGARGAADLPRPLAGETAKDLRHLPAVAGDEDFPSRLQELVDPVPGVADDAGPCPRRLEDAGRRREAVAGHALPVDVEDGERRAVE